MLAVNPAAQFKSAPNRGSRPPSPPAPPAASAAAAAMRGVAPSAGPTSPTGSRRPGRLQVQLQPQLQPQPQQQQRPQTTGFVDAREMKAAAAAGQYDDPKSGSGSASDSDGTYDRPKRRFVKPTVTTYETCFSRHATATAANGSAASANGGGAGGRRYNRRAGAQPRVGLASYSFINSSSSVSLAAAAASEAVSNSNNSTDADGGSDSAGGGVKRAPAVSSLSSVLQELMHGRHRALSSYVDATAPQLNPRTFVVQQDANGEFYVASSRGEKFAADSAIGKVFLQSAPERKGSSSSFLLASPDDHKLSSSGGYPSCTTASAADGHSENQNASEFAEASSSVMRRSDLDFSRSRKWPLRRSLHRRDSVERGAEGRGSGSSSKVHKVKLLGFSSIKSKLAARRSSLIGRGSLVGRGSLLGRKDDRPMTLDEMEHDVPAVLGGADEEGGHLSFHAAEEENVLPMLDPDLVDTRTRGDSSWEVPAVPLPVPASTNNFALSAGSDSTSSQPQPLPVVAVDKSKIVNRPIPYATGSAFQSDDDDDDDALNPLNRSFLNVRDIEFHPRTDKEAPVSVPADALDGVGEEDEEDEEEDECELSRQDQPVNAALQHERATFDTSDRRTAASAASSAAYDSNVRGYSFSGGAVAGGRVRVSSSSANVSEFLGGFKGQLSTRRSSLGGQDAFVNRTRSVRNGVRKSAAALAATQAANLAAAVLTQKLLEARSRIPPEFREDRPLPPKKKKKNRKPRIKWDLTLYCREFEVESEDEDAAKPEIVKAPWEYRDSEERDSDLSDDENW